MRREMAKPINLLLVEDDVSVREALIRILIEENYNVVSSSSCAEAVHRCRESQIDIVLLDLNLGDADGWTAFDALRMIRQDLPIIVASAQIDRLRNSSGRRVSGVLEKPFDLPVLLDLLSQAVNNHHPRKQ